MIRLLISVAVLGAVFAAAAQAMMAGNPTAGRTLVVEKCMACHRVPEEASEKLAKGAPGFDEIAADDAAYTLATIRQSLEERHWPNARLKLKTKQTDNVIAFVMSLRNAK